MRLNGGLNPLYSKAPFVLRRFPVLLSALALGISLLALVLVLYPLGLAVAGNRFLQGEISNGIATRYGMGIAYENETVRFDMTGPGDDTTPLYQRQEELFESEIARIDQLSEVLSSIRGPQVTVRSKSETRDGRLFFRENAASHVRIVEGEPGNGVMLADYAAEPLDVQPGDRLTLQSGGPPVRVTVDAIYAALFREPPAPFWRPWRSSIYPPCPGDPGTSGCAPPPPFLLAGKNEVIELSRRLGVKSAGFGWDAPLRDVSTFTMEDADALERSYRALVDTMSDPESPLHDVFLCCGPQYIRSESYLTETRLSSVVTQVTRQAEQRLDAAQTPLRVLQVIAILVAVAAILAAAAYSFSSRRTEVNLFFARGHSPTEMALRSALEVVLVSMAGSGVGIGFALLLALLAAGSTPVSGDAVNSAIATGVAIAPLVVAGLAIMTGLLFWRWKPLREEHAGRGNPRVVLEIGLIATALWLLANTVSSTEGFGAAQVATPIAILAASAVVAARVLKFLLARVAQRATHLSHPLYIAVHRAAAGQVGFLLFALAVTFFGVFQHGLSIASTLDDTVVAKSRLFVGSDVAATVDLGDVPPDQLQWPATPAWRIPHVEVVGTTREVDVIAVDPDSLPAAAYWDKRFGAPSLRGLMSQLEGPGSVFVGSEEDALGLSLGGAEMDVERVASVNAFPGMLSERPTIVVAQDYLRDAVEEQGSGLLSSSAVAAEWWIRGDPAAISDALPTVEDPPYAVLTAEEVRDIPYIATTLATFRILDALGVVGAILVIVASLAYLQSRERARAVSSQLALRMGMKKRSHAIGAIAELALLIVVAYAIAIVPAMVTARVLSVKLDPLQSIPPDVLFNVPAAWITAGALAAIAATIAGGVAVARRALRADMARLMRVAE